MRNKGTVLRKTFLNFASIISNTITIMSRLSFILSALLLFFGVCTAAAQNSPAAPVGLVFIGNSITYGALLESPTTQAPPIITAQLIRQQTGNDVYIKNCGLSGSTTYDWMPSTSLLQRAIDAARAYKGNGPLWFSIMLGTNDSAEKGPKGSPVSPANYKHNMQLIIDTLHALFPEAHFLINYPIWYSPTTHNGAIYLQAGLNRLQSYFPDIKTLVKENRKRGIAIVQGNKKAFNFFRGKNNLFTTEQGHSGLFYLHPNKEGAVELATFWAESLMRELKKD